MFFARLCFDTEPGVLFLLFFFAQLFLFLFLFVRVSLFSKIK